MGWCSHIGQPLHLYGAYAIQRRGILILRESRPGVDGRELRQAADVFLGASGACEKRPAFRATLLKLIQFRSVGKARLSEHECEYPRAATPVAEFAARRVNSAEKRGANRSLAPPSTLD